MPSGRLPAEIQRTSNYHRLMPTARERIIFDRGLSPFSRVNQCDLCFTGYVRSRHELVQVGRWMAHASCARHPETMNLESVKLPVLNYEPLRHLPPYVRIELMKLRCYEETWERMEGA